MSGDAKQWANIKREMKSWRSSWLLLKVLIALNLKHTCVALCVPGHGATLSGICPPYSGEKRGSQGGLHLKLKWGATKVTRQTECPADSLFRAAVTTGGSNALYSTGKGPERIQCITKTLWHNKTEFDLLHHTQCSSTGFHVDNTTQLGANNEAFSLRGHTYSDWRIVGTIYIKYPVMMNSNVENLEFLPDTPTPDFFFFLTFVVSENLQKMWNVYFPFFLTWFKFTFWG